ncbi:translation elongation factor [Hylemonella gracilis str. Niagara R]|uniref:Selenocysteine-specific elongation factor n=1 Tax=Hylemonella gracilis str. Niagara R TaxID=1458275 RepID=A0A016XE10_9BURK|nr:selenocysteine-specific translation elongation factor [Hylemonella gracilis]EYC50125.1 translation elongation factor [Hylemonella gracilis str. Niagara R]
MIVGTAGHIDHGKTTLVRALTGVDTDRLKEEKARGISIELGYAYIPLPQTTGEDAREVLGFIDVPGHEKFVHTMAAGVAGIAHALLVVAADDGVMPQTREHLAIALLLGVREGSIALTKTDRVDAARIATVRAELQALLAGTPLAGAALFETTATRDGDPGVAALRAHLFERARAHAARPDDGLFRLAVDRVFTLAGQGTVVTGTVFGGTARIGDSLRHSASGQLARVRSIHAQNRASASGHAGQRVALALAGIEKDAIQRGDWIADAPALRATRRMDVRLQLLPGAEIRAWTPVHVHLGAAHHLAHAVPLEGDLVRHGDSQRNTDTADQPSDAPAAKGTRVQLVFDADVYATAGDRYILRNAQASRTLGGGQVLDPYAPERKRRSPARLAWLDALQAALHDGGLAPLLDHAPHGLTRNHLALLLGRPPESLAWPADVLALPLAEGDALLVATAHWQGLRAQVLDALTRLHTQSPDEPGVNAARLRRMALPNLNAATQAQGDALWQGLLAALLAEGALAQSGAWLHLPTHRVELSAAEQTLAERLLPALRGASPVEGYDPPWVRDLARDFQVGEEVVRQLLRKLARQGALHQVVKDLFYSAERMDELAALIARLAVEAASGPAQESVDAVAVPATQGAVEAARFRDATGLGRKRAIQVLEYFDRVGYTRRVRDAHLLRPGVSWQGVA